MTFPTYPDALHVSGSSIQRCHEDPSDISDDPRGLLLMFEPPIPGAHYIMGCDPTVGITGWSRATRTEGDHKIDNGAIEIFRTEAIKLVFPDIDPLTGQPRFVLRDLQVAEYAAPVDAVEIARICNLLGRIYAGAEEDQCELIFEAYPGPGMLTTQELLRLGYGNLWMWEYIDSVAEQTTRIGWRSSRESQKMLWYRARRHLMGHAAKLLSPYLVAEYANAVIDVDKMRARAAYGSHDDRLQAANMAFWAGHKWTYDPDRTDEPVTSTAALDYQRMAPGLGEHRTARQAWAEAIDSWD